MMPKTQKKVNLIFPPAPVLSNREEPFIKRTVLKLIDLCFSVV